MVSFHGPRPHACGTGLDLRSAADFLGAHLSDLAGHRTLLPRAPRFVSGQAAILSKDTRPAVGGPYAWVRNPLYLGTYVMALGTALSVESWALLAIASVLFAVIYHFIILDEEIKLREIFGEPYLKFCALVPRFFPRPWPASRIALTAVNPEPAYRGLPGSLR